MSGERLLIVGTLGGGGIHRYVEAQRNHLRDHLDVSVYDMYSEPFGEGTTWFLRSLALSLLAALKFPLRSRPDVVHVHCSHRYSFVRAAFYVLFGAHVWRRPVVLHVHGSSFDEFLENESPLLVWLRALVFDASDAVVVLSPYWRETLRGSVPDDRLHVVPNAVDTEEYDPTFEVDRPHVVYLSSLVERKGVQEFVDAVDELQSRSVREFPVSIAGDGPLADVVEAVSARHENVSWLGYVSEAEKRELLESASIFVLPTYAEGLPIAMLEAMAGGNAVVSTSVGSIPEIVGPENGALVDAGDADDLADTLETLVGEPASVERMGRRNRGLARERYDWDGAVESLLAIYDEMMSGDQDDGVGRRPRETASQPSEGQARSEAGGD